MTVQEAAEKFRQPPRKLLDELQRKFPEQEWKLTSKLPEDFSEQVERFAREYMDDDDQDAGLPKAEITTTQEAVLDNRQLLEALEYGVLESLANLKYQDVQFLAQINAVEDIQAYQETYSSVWEKFFETQVTNSQNRGEAAQDSLKQRMMQRNQGVSKQQGTVIRLHHKRTREQEEQLRTAGVLVDFLTTPETPVGKEARA
jgi:cell division protein ZapA (FtsZ GTPase activity inhibitor)